MTRPPLLLLIGLLLLAVASPVQAQDRMLTDLGFFAGLGDRSTGTPGSAEAAEYIVKAFEAAGLTNVGAQKFLTPVPELDSASLEVAGTRYPIAPWGPNLVTLPVTPKEGLRGPLVYVGNGSFEQLSGKPIRGSIVLMEITSEDNWMHAAMLGAKALIFLGSGEATRGDFAVKEIPTPLAFPRYWVGQTEGEALVAAACAGTPEAIVTSRAHWQNALVRNCYGFVPGTDPELSKELVILDAFYDASSHVLGMAPGADEATSIAMLLETARALAKAPPARSVLFLATVGNAQSLAGMRQFIWSITTRKKLLRKDAKDLSAQSRTITHQMALLNAKDPLRLENPEDRSLIWQLVVEKAKDKADALSREIQYQKALGTEASGEDARPYRRLSWLLSPDELSADQVSLARTLLAEAGKDLRARQKEVSLRRDVNRSTCALRVRVEDYTPVLFLSLYLSSGSPHVMLSEMGETYPVRSDVKRVVRARRLAEFIGRTSAAVAGELGVPDIVRSPSEGPPSSSALGKGQPVSMPCCDVAILAGLPAVSLMTPDDYRPYWSTPQDTLDRVNRDNLARLAQFLPPLLSRVFSAPMGSSGQAGISGFASLEGQAMFIRQGELFPDQPAPGTIISIMQGDSVFRAMVFRDGTFFIPGLANKRVSLEKLILEPYGIDPETGRVAWTADKAQTGKVNYRIKVKTDLASTALVMFHCEQTDVMQVFNPNDLSYLTKVELLDAVTEATPLRYWYSRVDGRNTMAISVFLEKGTRFKLIMSKSLLGKDLFLLNGSPDHPEGTGFRIGDPLSIGLAPLQVADDLRYLLRERLQNLFRHGVSNRNIESLYDSAEREIDRSKAAFDRFAYADFWKDAVAAWAKLDLIYGEVESTQRDVLGGVMFFIALFVPFAYCLERYLFAFRSIYQQLAAFFGILVVTIVTIRALHPAFQLTYSPMVVIIAFFIVGLSLLVSWIIFMRFEREMAALHQRRTHVSTPQASKWQSFGAGFAIGVSNLNRRKLRTGLTCLTLVILTFTVMSFTNVKSLHTTTNTRIADTAAYPGVLLRHQYRLPLTLLNLDDMRARFESTAHIWPRGWVEPTESTERVLTRLHSATGKAPVEGVLGLGDQPPDYFRGLLSHGHWFGPDEDHGLLLSEQMATQLGLDPARDLGAPVWLMGVPFTVVGFFDSGRLESLQDLDQNPITPAYIEVSQNEEMSEAEIEAMQSGEEVLPQSERFRYAQAAATVIIPFDTSLDFGASLRAISILPQGTLTPMQAADQLTTWLTYPLFVGENGTWYHSAGTSLRYQGVANLIVPILIVVLITLNTMIGHVHERQKEIATYTSVGLAPTHVGFLFIVEALSLAVISTVIGYILAQLSAKTMSGSPLFAQLTFNYSSMASVACMFLVFSVVFLAALYPARMAAAIAMPDVNRTWTLPAPEGDSIFMNLPFLLKHEEESGVMAFLSSFIRSHEDVALGAFTVDGTALDEDVPQQRPGEMPAPVCLLLRANVWLAPFDFGIKQRLQLHCCPSEENPGYLEISIVMIRLSGERSAWERANRNFVKALRKQMLLWRLLDTEAKAQFAEAQEHAAAPERRAEGTHL